MPQAIYLDSNCMRYLFGSPVFNQGWTPNGAVALKAAVRQAIAADKVVVYGSHFHLEEASRIPVEEDRKRFLRFFWDTVWWYLLLPTQELVIDEARHRRPLEYNEPFETYWRRRQIRHMAKTDLDAVAADVKTFKDKAVTDSKTRLESAKTKLASAFSGVTPAEATKQWWKDAEVTIEDWVADYIASSKDFLGLDDDKAAWPGPRDLQTAWAIHAFLMARIVMNLGHGRTLDDGDLHDAHHYGTACYADVLVTEDRAFRDTLDIIPNSPITLLSFVEFAAQFGVTPH